MRHRPHVTRPVPLALVVAFALSVFGDFAQEARAQTVCDAEDIICLTLSANPSSTATATEPGSAFSLYVQADVTPEGAQLTSLIREFTVVTPAYFHGLAATVPPEAPWTRTCSLVSPTTPPIAANYAFTCTYRNETAPSGGGGAVNAGAFPIVMVAPRFSSVPDGYVGAVQVTYRAWSADWGDINDPVPHKEVTLSRDFKIDGRAYVRGVRLSLPVWSLAPIITVNVGTVSSPVMVTGRRFRVTHEITNSLSGTVIGSNQLVNAEMTVPIPDNVYYLGHGVANDTTPLDAGITPTANITYSGDVLQPGGNVHVSANNPLGVAAYPSSWWTYFTSGAMDSINEQTDMLYIDMLVPCSALGNVDRKYATASGDEVLHGAGAPIEHTWTSPSPQHVLYGIYGSTDANPTGNFCDPGAGTAAKTDSYASPDSSSPPNGNTWNIVFNAPIGTGPVSNVRFVDAIPPFHELVGPAYYYAADTGTATSTTHPNFSAPMYCRLPHLKTLNEPTTNLTGPAPSPPYRWTFGDLSAPGAPLPAWDTITRTGCVPAAQVQFALPYDSVAYAVEYDPAYPTLAPGTVVHARDIDFIAWEADEWVNLDANGDPDTNLPARSFRTSYPTRIRWLETLSEIHPLGQAAEILGTDPDRARARNIATLFRGTYDIGAGPRDYAALLGGQGATSYSVSHDILITQVLSVATSVGDSGALTVDEPYFVADRVGRVFGRFSVNLRLREPVVEFDLPKGFDLAPGASSGTHWRWAGDETIAANVAQSVATLVPTYCTPQLNGTAGNDNQFGLVQSNITLDIQTIDPGPNRYTRLTWRFPAGYNFGSCLPSSTFAFYAHIQPRADYDFTSLGEQFRFRVSAENHPTGTQSVGTVYVPTTVEVGAVDRPLCEVGDGRPTIELTMTNGSAGADGFMALSKVPATSSGGTSIYLRDVELVTPPDGWATVPEPPELEATTAVDPLDPAAVWAPLSTFTLPNLPPAIAITAVRVQYPDDVSFPPNASLKVLLRLAHPDATLADVGESFTTTAAVAAVGISMAESQPMEPPFVIGQCPISVRVIKFWDPNRNGIQEPGEDVIPGWSFMADGASALTGILDHFEEVTDAAGVATFELLPAGLWTIAETLPAPAGGVTWLASNGVTSQPLTVLFESPEPLAFGNSCTCDDQDLCTSEAACAYPGVCTFTAIAPNCPEVGDLCFDPTDTCDPATGGCLYERVGCLETEPRIVYVMVEDTTLPDRPIVGAITCHYNDLSATPPTLVCDDLDEDGFVDVDVSLTCGGGTRTTTGTTNTDRAEPAAP